MTDHQLQLAATVEAAKVSMGAARMLPNPFEDQSFLRFGGHFPEGDLNDLGQILAGDPRTDLRPLLRGFPAQV